MPEVADEDECSDACDVESVVIVRKQLKAKVEQSDDDSDGESVNLGFNKQLKRDLGSSASKGNFNTIASNAWRAAAKNTEWEKKRAENAAKLKLAAEQKNLSLIHI